jgi:predicted RNase H-like nuclease (RuvC/YqgF family)
MNCQELNRICYHPYQPIPGKPLIRKACEPCARIHGKWCSLQDVVGDKPVAKLVSPAPPVTSNKSNPPKPSKMKASPRKKYSSNEMAFPYLEASDPNSIKSQIRGLQHLIASKNRRIAELKGEVEALEERNDKLVRAKAEWEEEKIEMDNKYTQLQFRYDTAGENVRKLKAKVDDLEKVIEGNEKLIWSNEELLAHMDAN